MEDMYALSQQDAVKVLLNRFRIQWKKQMERLRSMYALTEGLLLLLQLQRLLSKNFSSLCC